MACGRPVVATDVGGVGEAVGDAGLLVPPRNPSAVAAACVRLLNDADERRALGEAARERVVRLFTAKQSFQTYRNVYDQLGSHQLRQPRAFRLPACGTTRTAYEPRHLRPGVPA
jgi:glycosyltransferase involved in cell wall biosynthesis